MGWLQQNNSFEILSAFRFFVALVVAGGKLFESADSHLGIPMKQCQIERPDNSSVSSGFEGARQGFQ